MKINFRKGFFRLFVLITAIFIAFGMIAYFNRGDAEPILILVILITILWGIYFSSIWIAKGFSSTQTHDEER